MAMLSLYAQSDSIGIYSVTETGLKHLELIKSRQTKVSGFMVYKAKLQFDGATSDNQFKDKAEFLLYYGEPSAREASRNFMFTPSFTIKDLGVVKLQQK